MTQTVFEKMKTAISVLKLDFTTEEFATFADDQELSEEAIEAVQTVFSYISEKKQQTTVQTLLKLSRLPKKAPKTFENFDFSLLKSRDLDQIRALPSLGVVYSHRNLAFIGPPGTGKTHLAQAFGYACCQHGMRAYFIKASELRDRFTAARRAGKTDSCLKSLVRPSCLIIDEIGHCEFDKENTRLFFDLIDRRYNKEDNLTWFSPATRIRLSGVRTLMRTLHFCVRWTASLMRLRYSSCGARASAGRNWIQFLYRLAK